MASESEILKFYERQYGPFVHMSEPEKAIWLRYLIQGGAILAPFTYDIRVGDGVDMGPDATGFEVRTAHALTTKRIDAIGRRGSTIVIIEVKQRAGLGAIGQVLGYRDLYLHTFGNSTPVEVLLITDQLQPDMDRILASQSIPFYEVGL